MPSASSWRTVVLRLAGGMACCLLGLAGAAEDAREAAKEVEKEVATAGKEAAKPEDAAAAPAGTRVVTQEGQVIAAEEVEEPDLAELPLSNAARVRLDRARDAVVQIRGFFGTA